VVFYEVGSRLDAIDSHALPTFARAFGLGEKTGLVHLPEAAGLVPDPTWKVDTYHQGWGTGDTVNMAIGQGFLLVTPLQMARMASAIANGGVIHQPTLIDRIAGNEQFPEQVMRPQAVNHLPISEAHLSIIRAAMLGVTTDTAIGTATHRFSGLGIPVAGKTGTAEVSQEGALPHSWFAGYFPANDPTIAMVVLVENAGEGSSVAAPMFRQILEGYYGLPITPLPEITPSP
jgi:penicillin-binding protein 2